MAATGAISVRDFTAGLQNAARPIDFTPLNKDLSQELVVSCKANIDNGTTADGTPFAPLKWPRPNSKGGDLPLQDTGALRSSIIAIYVGDRGFVVGTNLHYAAIHQFGGRIVPKNGKYLAIPATVEAQKAGSPRNWGEALKFKVVEKDGRHVKALVESKTRGKKRTWQEDVVQYFLAKSVDIPKREFLGISNAHADDMERMTADFVADVVSKRLRDAWGQP